MLSDVVKLPLGDGLLANECAPAIEEGVLELMQTHPHTFGKVHGGEVLSSMRCLQLLKSLDDRVHDHVAKVVNSVVDVNTFQWEVK